MNTYKVKTYRISFNLYFAFSFLASIRLFTLAALADLNFGSSKVQNPLKTMESHSHVDIPVTINMLTIASSRL